MTEGPTGQDRTISARTWIGLLIGAVVIIFIAANQDETSISFLFVDAVIPLWLALSLAGIGGFMAGFLFRRRRR